MKRRPPRSTRTDTLFPYTTLFRSLVLMGDPGRNYRPADGLERLTEYLVPTPRDLEDSDLRRTVVWRVLPSGRLSCRPGSCGLPSSVPVPCSTTRPGPSERAAAPASHSTMALPPAWPSGPATCPPPPPTAAPPAPP